MLSTNAENHSVTDRWLTSTLEELATFTTKVKVEAMLKKEKENASTTMFRIVMKPSYPVEIVPKLYLDGHIMP